MDFGSIVGYSENKYDVKYIFLIAMADYLEPREFQKLKIYFK